ncbi:GyrI-like domain-containing protein [Micrococcus terreus]|uniref:GyrI-like domain-containing protein n=1 Tax=Micrococcus terreus TaxID=574650 RepID=UPI00254CFB5A|nr:GyrI-like domain-containing protein [Micrococcus terreus]MDK7700786.1 GyrI-like domain-containing protein [Micrococcus terreus]WOO96946.1 GyrI-like domain-containing protein [Micrococcus terreus]
MAEKSDAQPEQTEQAEQKQAEQKSPEVKITRLEGATMAGVPAELSGPDQVGEVIGGMFSTAAEKIAAAGGTPGTGISVYDMDPEHPENGLSFTVGYLYAEGPVEGLQLADLPATEAAVLAHRGSMQSIGQSWQALEQWIAESGEWVASGPSREVYLQSGEDIPMDEWVTHLQQPVQPAVVAEGEHLEEDEVEVSAVDPNDAPSGDGPADGEDTADDSYDSEAEQEPGAENDAEDAPKVSEPGA